MSWRDLTNEALEHEMNPRSTVPDFAQHLERLRAQGEAARASLPLLRDLRYGAGPRQLLDLLPGEGGKAPVLLYFHGGYWRDLSKDAVSGVAQIMQQAGGLAVLPSYDLCPAVSLDRVVEEAREALAWTRAHAAEYGGDPERIVVGGSSAGAHLAAMLLLEEAGPAPAGAALFSGIYDLEPVPRLAVNEMIRLSGQAALRNSPARGRRRWHDVPVALYAGALESEAWIAQSRALAARLIEQGLSRVTFELMSEVHHFSLGVGDPAGAGGRRLARFLAEIQAQ